MRGGRPGPAPGGEQRPHRHRAGPVLDADEHQGGDRRPAGVVVARRHRLKDLLHCPGGSREDDHTTGGQREQAVLAGRWRSTWRCRHRRHWAAHGRRTTWGCRCCGGGRRCRAGAEGRAHLESHVGPRGDVREGRHRAQRVESRGGGLAPPRHTPRDWPPPWHRGHPGEDDSPAAARVAQPRGRREVLRATADPCPPMTPTAARASVGASPSASLIASSCSARTAVTRASLARSAFWAQS